LQGNPQSTNPTTENTKVHNVKKGDTLSQIAAGNDISVESLREANNLDPANDKKLQIGTELNIPTAASQSTADSALSFSDSFNFLDSGLSFEAPVQSSDDNGSSVSDFTNPISLGMGVAGQGLELSKSTFRLSAGAGKGFSPKIYSSGWRGGSRANITTYRFAKFGKLLSWGGFGVGVLFDAYGVMTYYKEGADAPNAVTPAKAGVNTSIGLYGILGGFGGAVLSPIYFGLEAFYPGGTEQALKDKAERDAETSKVLGRPFNSANQGTYSPFKW
jgi:LysM repeat protein